MGAIGLNPIRLDRIGLDPIRINAIKLGVPRAASDRPYIDPEVLASLKAVCICYGKSNDDPDRAIVKNLVDPDNPFVISNAAFKLNSGFGKYEISLTDSITPARGAKVTDNSIEVVDDTFISSWIYYSKMESAEINSYSIEISGMPEGKLVQYWYNNKEGVASRFDIKEDGIYTLPQSYVPADTGSNKTIGLRVQGSQSQNFVGFKVRIIPSFEGAFVTDGIDDLITSTKTVSEMGVTNEITIISMIHQINLHPTTTSVTNDIRVSSSDGSLSNGRNVISAEDKTGIYGWSRKDSTISVVNNILGDKNDYTAAGEVITNYNNKFSVVGTADNRYTSSVAWYWTVIANKVLTTDQINQVIAYFNLDRTLNPDILCNTIKQGITNENHAEFGDKLIDFSGNGRDIQLNNIAWKGDSGIGKYEVDFTSLDYNNTTSVFTSDYKSCSISKIIKDGSGNIFFNWGKTLAYVNSVRIQVTGLDEIGAVLEFMYLDESSNNVTKQYSADGVYDLPSSAAYQGDSYNSNFRISIREYIGDCNITITQIPSHAGALCLDGVNDFGKVTGMPVYKDYTVVTDREIFANIGAILSKNNPGAFVETAGNSVYSFGQATSGINSISTRSISYLSKYSYCGQSITAGAAEDGTDMWLGTIRDGDSHFLNGAIYSLMSFPYSMSEFLIERQLKKHKLGTLYPDMVEFRPIVKSNLPYSSISYSVNPGEYISVDSMVTITVTLPNTSDKLMEVSCNAISDISISGDNGVYEITGKIVKSPQKINMIISSYLTMLNNETLISNETLIKNE